MYWTNILFVNKDKTLFLVLDEILLLGKDGN